MPVSLPFTLVAKTKAKASEVMANLLALSAKFTTGAGGIVDADCSTTMDFDANKLSSSANKRIVAAKFEDDAVDLRALKDDATAGSPLAAVNTKFHIKDRIIPKTKLSIAAGEKISFAELDMLVEEVSFSIGISFISFVSATVHRTTSGANYQALVHVMTTSGGSWSVSAGNVVPTTPIPIATRKLIALYFIDIAIVGANCTGKLAFVSMPLT